MSKIAKLTLRNYRCFDWSHPAVLVFGDGFTAYVGQNNSGKSAVLRSVYELRNFLSGIFSCFSQTNSFQLQSQFIGVSDPSELANDADPTRFQFEIEIPIAESEYKNVWLAHKAVFEIDVAKMIATPVSVEASSDGEFLALNRKDIERGGSSNDYLVPFQSRKIDYHPLVKFSQSLAMAKYFPAFRNAINEGAGNYYDIPVGTALVGAWDNWKAGTMRSHKLAISSVEKEIAQLLGFSSLQVNADQTGKTLDLIIDGKPHKLYEVGAGVAQLIIVFAAALVSKPPYILIDEPELSLHPNLQLNFLSTLASYAERGVVFSTHSIGLARSTASRIFVTKKLEPGKSRMDLLGERPAHFVEMLGELSFSTRSELGCEGILIVEGPTDVLLFQEFLRKFGIDGKIVVMQLGGASLINSSIRTHLTELGRIVEMSKIHIFIDSEKGDKDADMAKDRLLFLEACKQCGVNAVASERRATENYFTERAVKATLGQDYIALSEYQLLKQSPKPWGKSDNWRIAREMNKSEIRDTDIGRFIEKLLPC